MELNSCLGRNGFVKPAHAMFRYMTQTVLLTLLNINLFLLFPYYLKKKKRLELPYEFTTMGVDSMTKVQVIFLLKFIKILANR